MDPEEMMERIDSLKVGDKVPIRVRGELVEGEFKGEKGGKLAFSYVTGGEGKTRTRSITAEQYREELEAIGKQPTKRQRGGAAATVAVTAGAAVPPPVQVAHAIPAVPMPAVSGGVVPVSVVPSGLSQPMPVVPAAVHQVSGLMSTGTPAVVQVVRPAAATQGTVQVVPSVAHVVDASAAQAEGEGEDEDEKGKRKRRRPAEASDSHIHEEHSVRKNVSQRPKGADPHRRVFWTSLETYYLLHGVCRFGVGQWATILRNERYRFDPRRTSVHLKDRYRTLVKKAMHNLDHWAQSVQQDKLLEEPTPDMTNVGPHKGRPPMSDPSTEPVLRGPLKLREEMPPPGLDSVAERADRVAMEMGRISVEPHGHAAMVLPGAQHAAAAAAALPASHAPKDTVFATFHPPQDKAGLQECRFALSASTLVQNVLEVLRRTWQYSPHDRLSLLHHRGSLADRLQQHETIGNSGVQSGQVDFYVVVEPADLDTV